MISACLSSRPTFRLPTVAVVEVIVVAVVSVVVVVAVAVVVRIAVVAEDDLRPGSRSLRT